MKRVVIIHTDGNVEPALIYADHPYKPEYQQLQEMVGGYIESPPQPHPNLNIFSNEEGKLIGLAPNHLATAIFGGLLWQGDYLCGPVVVTGDVDENGETQGLTEDQAAVFLGIDYTATANTLNALVTRHDA